MKNVFIFAILSVSSWSALAGSTICGTIGQQYDSYVISASGRKTILIPATQGLHGELREAASNKGKKYCVQGELSRNGFSVDSIEPVAVGDH